MIRRVLQHFRLQTDERDFLTVWIDVHGKSMNVFSDAVISELEYVVQELESVTPAAVVFRSAKSSGFFAGADVHQIASLADSSEVEEVIRR